ncbi:MAG: ABC transporter ATP-binding protein [Chloroflexi bacterium]|nr:ABC transporter ATP-binding protein [Chloroflexota bacterium]
MHTQGIKRDPKSASDPVVQAKDLLVELGGRRVLEIPSLQVQPNEVLVIIGPNGSGKTTLLLCLALLLKPTAGTVLYQSQPVNSNSSVLRWRRRIAVVFQDPLLLNTTVQDNVALGMRLRGVSHAITRERTERWLARFGVAALAPRQSKTLSGGEAQRVSLARAFALQPEVLFLDEPFTALDVPTRQALTEDFQKVLAETGITAVMVTHDRNEALALATRTAVLIAGGIRQTGAPHEVFSSPADEAVAGFVGVENIWRGRIASNTNGIATVAVGARHIDAVSELPAGSPVTTCLRPEDVTVSVPAQSPPHTSARNKLPGLVVKAFPLGSQVRVTVDCGFPVVALITARSYDELGLETGREAAVSFKASSVHLLPSPEKTQPFP